MKIKSLFLALLFLLSGCSVDPSSLSTQQPEEAVWNDSFEYQVCDGEITITYVLIDEETITIPDSVAGLPVTGIGASACTHKQKCTQIILPDTLKHISDSAFYRCVNLVQIAIPANVCSIGENPFFRCSSLTDIIVGADNQHYSGIDGALYDKSASVLLAYPEGRQNDHYNVPQSVVSIDDSAFGYHSCLHTIYIGRNVTALPDGNMFVYPEDVTLMVEEGSAAHKYSQTYSLAFKLSDSIDPS